MIQLKRGTNISHWLSQSETRGVARKNYFTQDDVKRIADWGFDHIRLPIDEVQMWDAAGRQDPEAFGLLESALNWIDRAGLNVIIDLHILRSHFFNQGTEPALFTDPAEAHKFAGFWRQLSARFGDRPNDRVAYELMNEPVATNAADWNRVSQIALRAIRETESERPVVLGSNRWSHVFSFNELEVPNDRHLILTFHYYLPMLITHHRAPWSLEGRLYSGPVQYPGKPIPDAQFAALPADVRKQVEPFNRYYDRDVMISNLSQPLAAAKRTGLPLYCGEFGVIDNTPHDIRLAWFRDVISVFEQFDIGCANWDYKEEFGLLTKGESNGIAEILLGSELAGASK